MDISKSIFSKSWSLNNDSSVTIDDDETWVLSSGNVSSKPAPMPSHVDVYVVDKDVSPTDDEGIFECSYHHSTEHITIPMEIFTYLSLNGIPYQTCRTGLILKTKHLAILMLMSE